MRRGVRVEGEVCCGRPIQTHSVCRIDRWTHLSHPHSRSPFDLIPCVACFVMLSLRRARPTPVPPPADPRRLRNEGCWRGPCPTRPLEARRSCQHPRAACRARAAQSDARVGRKRRAPQTHRWFCGRQNGPHARIPVASVIARARHLPVAGAAGRRCSRHLALRALFERLPGRRVLATSRASAHRSKSAPTAS
ncbi:MAG: hypothetical protein J3K34DRAFT_292286 [Monoraphidium minutum]|nr:MAG: hypothetical protein J3K34DRAFT_292286 [Monoraphidium minutum]